MLQIVLASGSRYRRELLGRLGVPFACADHRHLESIPPGAEPGALVLRLAEAKARSLVRDFPNALIIGSDQVAELDGQILGKPGTPERAMAQLRNMQGKEHRLYTAVAVVEAPTGRVRSHLERSPLRIRSLTEEEIAAYVRQDKPVDCAGSYRSESLGIALLDYQRGDDPTAVVGLPLIGLCRLLRGFGVRIPG